LSHQSKSTKIFPATVGVKGLRFTPRKSLNREVIMFPALSSLQPSRSPWPTYLNHKFVSLVWDSKICSLLV